MERLSAPSPPTLMKGFPEIPSSGTGGRDGAMANFGRSFSCRGVKDMGTWWERLSIDAERLVGGFEIREDARPLDEVDRPGRTKLSVLGAEVETDKGMRGGTTMAVGRSFSTAAMTFSMTCSWSRSRCFLLVTSQKASLSMFEASTSSSWQHTGVAVFANASRGCSRGVLDWLSWTCFSLCFRIRASTIVWRATELAEAIEGSRLLLAKEAW